ncbi:MAG TPA: acetylglutamate kinase [Vicinamibacterales bacterium]|jgi:acetylglutamate kinase|nr:acetylglutamate kinase [Vicinamibacterales bacterium]
MAGRSPAAPVVLKFGGELLEEPPRVGALASAVARLSRAMPLVIVHGGGREIDAALARAGIEKRQVDGLRVTDERTLDIVVSVLAGLINTRLVAALGAAGVPAVGLTGADAGIGPVRPAEPHISANGTAVDLGRVGEPAGTGKPALLMDLCKKGYVPVVSSIGAARDGRLFNVNADTLAGNLAGRLKSPRLVVAGATAGVLDGRGGTIAELSFGDIESLVAGGGATAGMVAKLSACRQAVEGGAKEVFIADGRDAVALSVLARHGRAAGAAKSTRIDHASVSKRRQIKRKAS